jgi:hypothetical protein
MILDANEILNPFASWTDNRHRHTFWNIEQVLSFHNWNQDDMRLNCWYYNVLTPLETIKLWYSMMCIQYCIYVYIHHIYIYIHTPYIYIHTPYIIYICNTIYIYTHIKLYSYTYIYLLRHINTHHTQLHLILHSFLPTSSWSSSPVSSMEPSGFPHAVRAQSRGDQIYIDRYNMIEFYVCSQWILSIDLLIEFI